MKFAIRFWTKNIILVLGTWILSCFLSAPPLTAAVTQDHGGAHLSPLSTEFQVKVNGQSLNVNAFINRDVERKRIKESHVAWFDFSGEVDVEVIYKTTIDPDQFQLSPAAFNIPCQITGNRVRFRLTQPRKLNLMFAQPKTERRWRHELPQLHIFAERPDPARPREGDPAVKTVHDQAELSATLPKLQPGHTLFLKQGRYEGFAVPVDRLTIYFDSGAVVQGAKANPLSVFEKDQIKILGRGYIISDSLVFLPEASPRLHVEGVTWISRNLQKGFNICLIFCDHAKLINTKLLALGSGGGIQNNFCNDHLIENCFIRCSDDVITVKARPGHHPFYNPNDRPARLVERWVVRDNVCLGGEFKIGSEIAEGVADYLAENNYLLANGVRISAQSYTKGEMRNMAYRGIRVENANFGFFEMGYTTTWLKPVRHHALVPGIDVIVTDMVVDRIWPDDDQYFGLIVQGAANGKKRSVVFENLRVKNPLTGQYEKIRELEQLRKMGLKHMIVENADLVFR